MLRVKVKNRGGFARLEIVGNLPYERREEFLKVLLEELDSAEEQSDAAAGVPAAHAGLAQTPVPGVPVNVGLTPVTVKVEQVPTVAPLMPAPLAATDSAAVSEQQRQGIADAQRIAVRILALQRDGMALEDASRQAIAELG